MNTHAKNTTEWPMKVFYDGSCPICSREIRTYQNRDKYNRLIPIDITDPSFVAGEYGLDPEAVNKELHACTADGKVYTAVDAFRKIWQAVGMQPLATLTRLPGLSLSMDLGYKLFSRYRHQLTGQCNRHTCSR